MRAGNQGRVMRCLGVCLLLICAPVSLFGQASEAFDIASLLRERDPDTMLGSLKEAMQEKVNDRWQQVLMEDSQTAARRNLSDLYPNPGLQAYVNKLGQSLIPKEASEKIYISFRIVEDPLPFADSLATGTVYLSTGMISLLDNESQLAFLLMHEAGHVVLSHHLHQFIEEEKAEKKAKRIRLIGAAAGILLGAVGGGGGGSDAMGALGGGVIGYTGTAVGLDFAKAFRNHRFQREIQIESDQFATQVLLHQGFDAREAPVLMAKVGDVVRRSGGVVQLAFGNAKDLPERSAKIGGLLGGTYRPIIDRVLAGKGFRMSSPRFSTLMSELKRDNGLMALSRDLFVMARTNLEEAAAVRTDDPLTMFGLGLLYRTIGRTEAEIARAGGYFKAAMEFDEVRHRFPEVYLHYAVQMLSREDPQRYPDIQKALKTYVVLYQRKSGGSLPREMRFIYDYLDLTGDRSWIAYDVNNVSSEAPYQLSGDAKLDGRAEQPQPKPATKKP